MTMAPEAMNLRLQRVDRTVVLYVQGELDMATSPDLCMRVLDQSDLAGATLVVDLSGVTFCDSSGIARLIDLHHHMEAQGGTFAVAKPSPTVARTLALARMDQAFSILP